MAIVQMKKLRLLAVRDSKEELLKELALRGCVEFSETESALEGSEEASLSFSPQSPSWKTASCSTTPALPGRCAPRKPSKATTRASSASARRRAGCAP